MQSAVPPQGAGQTDEAYRTALVDAIALIDKTKRDIKAQIHSAAITAKAEQCSIDQVWLRRAKDKIDHLTREREEVRHALGDVNRRIKDRRVASHGWPSTSSQESEVGGAMIERQHVASGRRGQGFRHEVQGETVAEAFMRLAKARLLPEVYEDLLRDAKDAGGSGD
jgi:hypothetical protein